MCVSLFPLVPFKYAWVCLTYRDIPYRFTIRNCNFWNVLYVAGPLWGQSPGIGKRMWLKRACNSSHRSRTSNVQHKKGNSETNDYNNIICPYTTCHCTESLNICLSNVYVQEIHLQLLLLPVSLQRLDERHGNPRAYFSADCFYGSPREQTLYVTFSWFPDNEKSNQPGRSIVLIINHTFLHHVSYHSRWRQVRHSAKSCTVLPA